MADATGSFRNAFGSLIVFFVVGIAFLIPFDHELGKRQCKAFEAKEAAAARGEGGNVEGGNVEGGKVELIDAMMIPRQSGSLGSIDVEK